MIQIQTQELMRIFVRGKAYAQTRARVVDQMMIICYKIWHEIKIHNRTSYRSI